jgi:hypothetical protein
MGLLSNIEHSLENGLSSFGHAIVEDCKTVEPDVVNSARVGEVLLEGAWDYTKEHPGEVAKTLAIAAGVGVATALVSPLLPAIAVVGVCGAVGAVGTAALAVDTATSFKDCWSDMKIVWDADHHSKEEVSAAEKSVEQHTGAAVTNLALLPVTFLVGNAAGNAAMGMFAGSEAATAAAASSGATAGTEVIAASAGSDAVAATVGSEAVAASMGSEAASSVSAATSAGAAASTECSVSAAAVGDSIPCPSIWTRIEGNPVYNFFSSPYVAENDIRSLATGIGKLMSTESAAVSRHAS